LVLTIAGLVACGGNETMTPPAPTHVAFVIQPSSGYPGEVFSPALQVEIRDASENRVTNAQNPVTLAIGATAAGAMLSGTKTVNAVAGVATFADLTIAHTGTGYTLVATSGSLSMSTSSSFNIWFAFATVGAGGEHTCGVTTAGAAYCWGLGIDGQLGDGFPAPNRLTPVAVVNSPGFAAVSGGLYHTCGVSMTAAAYCWGFNLPCPGCASSPAVFLSGVSFTVVSAGWTHACGVTTTGAAYCWYYNESGQLGDGTTTNSTTPVLVLGNLTFAGVSAGFIHTCGITSAGAAYCWGNNGRGQLGDGTIMGRTSPVAVQGGLTFAAVSAGGYHTCGITTAGATYCWGDDVTAPVAVPGAVSFAAVSAGFYHTCGVTASGVAYCWGSNAYGQLGDGTTTNRTMPAAVVGGRTFATVSAGGSHSCGITTVGAAYCWGENYNGQIGDGTGNHRNTPVRVIQ
jgi:alpha-tubulin suppressor-like RCC1 family protein